MENNTPTQVSLNEIKKALYKQNPIANLEYIRKGIAYYTSVINENDMIYFEVPCNDMGEADFTPHMKAKYLIRYIIN